MNRPRVELFYFDAGGGHRNAMEALAEVMKSQHQDWDICPVDLQRVLETADPIYQITRRANLSLRQKINPVDSQTLYNTALKKGYTCGFSLLLPALKRAIGKRAPQLEALLRDRWQKAMEPDLVVSLVPNFNGILYRALKAAWPNARYATVMTDIVDVPPHFWIEPGQDQLVFCGSHTARTQAEQAGYKPHQIIETSGMILKRSFYENPVSPLTREALGLHPMRTTALVMFGGNGSMTAEKITETLWDCGVQSIVLCGKNTLLLKRLQKRPGCHAVGFTNAVAQYMRLADFFIGKPGPGAVSEALFCGCPVMVENNATTMPQERPNALWIVENGVGMTVKSFRCGLGKNIARMLANLPTYRDAIQKRPENRAVFEVEEGLALLLATPSHNLNAAKEPSPPPSRRDPILPQPIGHSP